MRALEFSAEVLGTRRSVIVPLEILPDILVQDDGDASHTLNEVELQVQNDPGLYFGFYSDAQDEDYDAELTDRRLEWVEV